MTNERFEQLMRDDSASLTTDELLLGWHFCPEWDGLLVRAGVDEVCNVAEREGISQ